MKIHYAFLTVVLCASLAHAHPDHGDPPTRPREIPPAPPARSIAIEMTDKRCNPAEVAAAPGEKLRFVATNATQIALDFAVGSVDELKAHAEMVRKFPGMQGGKRGRVSVEAGKSAELVWNAPRRGRFAIACAAPGQFDAAGAGQVVVGKP